MEVAVAVAAGVRWRGAGGAGVSWTTGSLLASAWLGLGLFAASKRLNG